jgi:hypothetical protein
MKKSLLLYLFILAVLMNVFTYAYFSRKEAFDAAHPMVAHPDQKTKDSLNLLYNKWQDADYFSLEYDQNAQDYIVSNDIDKIVPLDKMPAYVVQKLTDFNDSPQGNPYTGQEKLGEQKFIINHAKVLNHRWIVADYSDGTYWGEVLLKYFINPDKSVSFEVIQSILYQKQK